MLKKKEACPLAVRRAWELASSHGHHWAADATPAALAYGRAIIALQAAKEARNVTEVCEAQRRLRAAEEAYRERGQDERNAAAIAGGIPPATEEEARALSALPAGPLGGIPFGLRHTTGTGRLRWEVCPVTGNVVLEVHRPAGRCLRAEIRGEGARSVVRIETGPRAIRVRHVETLNAALAALDLPGIDPADLRLADQTGRTPVWWDAIEQFEAGEY